MTWSESASETPGTRMDMVGEEGIRPATHFSQTMAEVEDVDIPTLLERIAAEMAAVDIGPGDLISLSYDSELENDEFRPVFTLAFGPEAAGSETWSTRSPDAEPGARNRERYRRIGFPARHVVVSIDEDDPAGASGLLRQVAAVVREFELSAEDIIAMSYSRVWQESSWRPAVIVVLAVDDPPDSHAG